jgi:hypothetical protein
MHVLRTWDVLGAVGCKDKDCFSGVGVGNCGLGPKLV